MLREWIATLDDKLAVTRRDLHSASAEASSQRKKTRKKKKKTAGHIPTAVSPRQRMRPSIAQIRRWRRAISSENAAALALG